MLSRHLHSFALALAVGVLALILSGAAQLGLPASEPHRGLSGIVVVLALLTTVAAWKRPRPWLRHLGLRHLAAGSLVAVLTLGALGIWMDVSAWAIVAHACFSHILFAAVVALALATSPSWSLPPDGVDDTGSPSLRTLGMVVPVAVFVQIFLGAIYRHLNLPVWPHIAGSLLVGCLLLYTGIVVLESHSAHKALRTSAQVLLAITVLQIAFGLGAFLGRVMVGDGMQPEWWSILARTLHVATGALTLAAAVSYAMQTNYHVSEDPIGKSPIEKSVVA